MAVIQPKKKAVIQKGAGYAYIAASFEKEHKTKNFHVIDDPQELLRLVDPFVIDDRKFITFDTETHPFFSDSRKLPPGIVRRWVGKGNKAVPQDFPFCISICDGKNSYTIFDDSNNNFEKFKALSPLFENPSIEKIAHNCKYDMHMFANVGMKIIGRLHDTVVLAKLANENRKSYALRDLAAEIPGGIVKYEYMVDNYKQMNKIADYRYIPRELLAEYANADVWNCYLEFARDFEVIKIDELTSLYDNECELMVALYAMERYGMRTDEGYEPVLKGELQLVTDTAENEIYKQAGRMFNINSGKQLYDVLVATGVDAQWVGMSDKGNPKLDADALERLAKVHNVSIVKSILEFRTNTKLLNTYAIGIYGQRDSYGRVHGSINQTEATTGRMSITKPALQTLPKKDTRIRKIFIPDDNHQLWFMDLDQIEYRLFAHYAKSEDLLASITAGFDVHAATASTLYNKDIADVTKEERSRAKTMNFALLYGMGNTALANDLGVTVTEAENFKAMYFAKIPEARPFVDMVHQVIKVRGFVKNFYGRRRRLTSDECYKAPNSLIQGCAADYIKHKLVDMYKYLRYNNLQTNLINIVHDEVVINMHNDEVDQAPVLRWLLSDFRMFRCDITAGVECGNPSWGEKMDPENIGFKEPEDKGYLKYNVYDGHVFDIYK